MKILFVSNSKGLTGQSVITIQREVNELYDYEVHLYNHDSGHTETWTVENSFEKALMMHRQLCQKCCILPNI